MTTEELFSIKIKEPDKEIYGQARQKWDRKAKPIDGLGAFEDMVSRISAIDDNLCPDISRKALVIMCADNGVFEEGVSQTQQRVTMDVAKLMGEKKSSVGIMTGNYPVDSFVFDIGINSEDKPEGVIDARICRGTKNFVKEPAMSGDECLSAIDTGIKTVCKLKNEGYKIIATGEMGIGNTTTSTALLCAIMGISPDLVTGRGAGLSDDALKIKTEVIRKGLALHRGEKAGQRAGSESDVLECLRCLGGLDIAGLAGVFIGGAIYHVPVVIDGLISAVAALTADRLVPGCRQYMLPSHTGREKGIAVIMDELSLKPVIHADLALGEGTGAIFLFPMLDMAMTLFNEGTAFGDTEIDQYERFD